MQVSNTTTKTPRRFTPIGSAVIIFLCVCLIVFTRLTSSSESTNNGPTEEIRPADIASETAEATRTAKPEIIGAIPGLSPVDVTVNLEQRQFTCTTVEKRVLYYERTCTREEKGRYLFHVIIWGREPFIVDVIEASVLQYITPDNAIAIPVLGFIATMPYNNARPQDARAWVESTIPTLTGEPGGGQEKTFAGVKYVLYGSSTAITLEMGELE